LGLFGSGGVEEVEFGEIANLSKEEEEIEGFDVLEVDWSKEELKS
jgi:hypothetical protein